MRFRSYRGSGGGARTALVILTMVAVPEQLAQAERTLSWCAEHQPTMGEFRAALDELRVAVSAREE